MKNHKNQKVFHFLSNNPSELLRLDKTLGDRAARQGKVLDLPILGSIKSFEEKNTLELKRNLINAVFTKETLAGDFAKLCCYDYNYSSCKRGSTMLIARSLLSLSSKYGKLLLK